MTHIDVHSALQETLQAPYHDLVTRRTGAAVRTFVEHQLAGLADGTVAYLDFSRIGVLDRSCADEFVAKLMLPLANERPGRGGYVVLHGVSEWHLETIESVLDAHGLALVVQIAEGSAHLVGSVTEAERSLWELVMRGGGSDPEGLADAAGLSTETAHAMLESLAIRRLVRRDGDTYVPLGVDT
jgi:hypothetical protein